MLYLNMVLFDAISKHGFVPEGFGSEIIILLLKDKASSVNDIDNYRAITIIPVISKLFEGDIRKSGKIGRYASQEVIIDLVRMK